ncbi:hypothetical protein [Aestuariivivens sp. NBU2969]|uniref:hypothetical protein n=1 Tax=Aestuariivivens sp. NBU2969 TaxID=2873267 RepID=UPI001CBB612A|nr:hypothetical protein [Aestuariivivens sp. NBU2969]
MKNIITDFQNRFSENSVSKLPILFVCCLFEFAVIVTIFPVFFSLNDDTAMNAIASGAISGNPSEFLLFTNVILGYILKLLFTYAPTINWYSWYLLSALFMGYFAIQYAFATTNESLWLKIFRHVLILALIMTSLLFITFTVVAAVVLIGGVLLIFTAKNKSYLEMGFGVFLMVLGALIRADVFKMILLLGLPLFAYLLYTKHYNKLLFIVLSVLLSIGSGIIDDIVYNKHIEFKEYREFNKLRSKVTASDNSQMRFNLSAELLKEIGWSLKDLELVAFFNLDVGHLKFTKDKLIKVAYSGPKLTEKISLAYIYENLKTIIKVFYNYFKTFIQWLLVFILLTLFFIEHKWKQLLILFSAFIYVVIISLIILIYVEGQLKPNITFGLLLPIGLLLIYFLNFDHLFQRIAIRNLKYLKMGLFIFSFGVLLVPLSKSVMKMDAVNEAFETNQKIHAALEARPESFYVSWVVLQFYPIFDTPFKNTKAYSLGWLAGSPANKDKIEHYTGNRNLGVYTIFNQDIVWYFQNDIYYSMFGKKVYDFYLSNYPKCNFKEEIIPVTDNNMLIKHTYHIKM